MTGAWVQAKVTIHLNFSNSKQKLSEIIQLRLREPHLLYLNGMGEDFTRAEADVDVTLCNFVKVTGWHLQLHSKGETDVGRRK